MIERVLYGMKKVVSLPLKGCCNLFQRLTSYLQKLVTLIKNSPKLSAIWLGAGVASIILLFGFINLEHSGVKQLNQQNQASLQQIVKSNRAKIVADEPLKIKKGNYNQTVKSASTNDFLAAKQRYQTALNNSLIGEVKIPSIGVDLPIFSGMANENLLNGVGTLSKTQTMGLGNYVMMAHNLGDQYHKALLEPLKDIKPGAKIIITNFDTVYMYQTFYKNVIKANQTAVLGDSKSPIVTLFRCVGGANTTKRLVVQASLDSVESYSNSPKTNKADMVLSPKKDTTKPYKLDYSKTKTKPSSAVQLFSVLALTGKISQDWLQMLLVLIPLIITAGWLWAQKRVRSSRTNKSSTGLGK